MSRKQCLKSTYRERIKRFVSQNFAKGFPKIWGRIQAPSSQESWPKKDADKRAVTFVVLAAQMRLLPGCSRPTGDQHFMGVQNGRVKGLAMPADVNIGEVVRAIHLVGASA
eukprot:429573-Pelagomonas_calceolata.AAC.1